MAVRPGAGRRERRGTVLQWRTLSPGVSMFDRQARLSCLIHCCYGLGNVGPATCPRTGIWNGRTIASGRGRTPRAGVGPASRDQQPRRAGDLRCGQPRRRQRRDCFVASAPRNDGREGTSPWTLISVSSSSSSSPCSPWPGCFLNGRPATRSQTRRRARKGQAESVARLSAAVCGGRLRWVNPGCRFAHPGYTLLVLNPAAWRCRESRPRRR